MAKKLIVANWKMNPDSLREAKEIFLPVKRALSKLNKIEVVICPPALFLSGLVNGAPTPRLFFGAQDAFWESSGAYTGQISATMLRKAGARYVILGHSEKRAAGETDELISRKLKASLKEGLRVILCVGERTRDSHGFYLKTLKQELEEGLRSVIKRQMSGLIIAYEPLWAVGARQADTPADFMEQAIFIRKVLSGLAGQEIARSVPVLYGGSVNVKNAAAFLGAGQADGLLVGRESLRADHFIEILKIA